MRRFALFHQGERILLHEGETVVGRALGCEIRFNDPSVSREHVCITVRDGAASAANLSTHGTQLNGKLFTDRTPLRDGDELRLGHQRVRVHTVEEAEEEPPPHEMLSYEQRPTLDIPIEGPLLDAEATRPGVEGWQLRRDLLAPAGTAPAATTGGVGRPGRAAAARDDARYRLEVPVIYSSGTLTVEAVVRDLSQGGLFIATDVLDPVGTPCALTALPDGSPALHFSGVVAHVGESGAMGHGLGIQLVSGSPEAMRWLERTVGRQGQAIVARRAR